MKIRNEKAFRNEHRSIVSNAPVAFTSSKFALMLEGRDYVPGGARLFLKGHDVYLNTWTSPGVEPVSGDCQTILNHFKFMFPDEAVRDHWLNCFASLVQNPDEKIKHCLLLVGEQGVGKSYFKRLLSELLGARNIALIDSGAWSQTFNAHMLNAHVGVIEELMAGRQLESYNELKQYVSESHVMANKKFVSPYLARTPYLMIALSNHRKPIILEPTDRRFHVYHSPAKKHDDDQYYCKLFGSIKQELPAFLDVLLQRDLAGFSPDTPPPMTDSKRELLSLSENPLHTALKSLISEDVGCFAKQVFTLDEVSTTLLGSGRYQSGRLTPQKLSAALLDMGMTKLGVRRLGEHQKKFSLWAAKDGEQWENASKAELTEEFEKTDTTSRHAL